MVGIKEVFWLWVHTIRTCRRTCAPPADKNRHRHQAEHEVVTAQSRISRARNASPGPAMEDKEPSVMDCKYKACKALGASYFPFPRNGERVRGGRGADYDCTEARRARGHAQRPTEVNASCWPSDSNRTLGACSVGPARAYRSIFADSFDRGRETCIERRRTATSFDGG